MNISKSEKLYQEACEVIPGGVQSAFRDVRHLGQKTPIYAYGGNGPYITDVDGKEYIDMSMAWGPLLFGHSHPDIVDAIVGQSQTLAIAGVCTESEVKLSQMICQQFPSIEMVRFQASGTEAVGSALRLARAYTNRDDIIMIRGGYHGHRDATLYRINKKGEREPGSPGIPESIQSLTHMVPYNDVGALEKLIMGVGGEKFAAVIVEPVPANMGLTLPGEGYLESLREICDEHGIVLIFDEVISGLWVHPGGAQEKYNVTPDLTILGKAVGGGMPLGVFGGSRKIMQMIKPSGPVYAAGTFAGHPVSVAAGVAVFDLLQNQKHLLSDAYARAEKFKERCNKILSKITEHHVRVKSCGALVNIQFRDEQGNLQDRPFNEMYRHMMSNGIYLSPAHEDPMFFSVAHTDSVCDNLYGALMGFVKNRYALNSEGM